APSLCSALAIADSSTLRMIRAPFLGLNASKLSALSTGIPRIWSATRRPFWADNRTPRNTAEVFIVISSFPLLLRRRSRSHCDFLVTGVALESTGQRKFAQFVSHHVFADID